MLGTLKDPSIARKQFSEQFGLQLLTELLASNSPLISPIQLSADLSALVSRAMRNSHTTLRGTPQLSYSYPDMERHPQQAYRSPTPHEP